MGQFTELTGRSGVSIAGYSSVPANELAGPGVVVLQEYWGIHSPKSHIPATCDRLAKAGFEAFAPDLFHGKKAERPADASALMGALDWGAAISEIHQSALYVGRGGEKVAVLGFCMGGALTIGASLQLHDFAAAVCFYGIPPQADASKLQVPLLAHFATRDEWCNARAVGALEKQLAEGHVEHTIYKYDAEHAFMNHHRPEVHDPRSAELAWDRTIAFLKQKLG